jgi:queuine tRNA-ribosyltransferase
MPIAFEIKMTSDGARAGTLRTDHGDVHTPVFMPVGTQAAVKAASPSVLHDIGAEIILANAYHLALRPGVSLIEDAGGLHRFMSWEKPILTDSGGFQVLSLADLRKIGDEGITFRSHIDGSLHLFTPEVMIETQARIGADIIMSFDYCIAHPCERAEAERAVALTSDWALRGSRVFGTRFDYKGYERSVFGIVQGATYPDLRRRSAADIVDMDFPGYALGGLSVGEEKRRTWDIVEQTTELLPADRPRYLMGLGTPLDLVEGVSRGVDLFDCVLPTRNARNGTVFSRHGKLVLKNAAFSRDFSPIDEECNCRTCRNYTRAYLRHLFMAGEILGPILATQHSLHFYCDLMREMRIAIEEGEFSRFRNRFIAQYGMDEVNGAKSA